MIIDELDVRKKELLFKIDEFQKELKKVDEEIRNRDRLELEERNKEKNNVAGWLRFFKFISLFLPDAPVYIRDNQVLVAYRENAGFRDSPNVIQSIKDLGWIPDGDEGDTYFIKTDERSD